VDRSRRRADGAAARPQGQVRNGGRREVARGTAVAVKPKTKTKTIDGVADGIEDLGNRWGGLR
jgi:hypothetical protein